MNDNAVPLVVEFAPAKINLALHVTGRRLDGYHLLDSLVVFADVGDELEFFAAPEFSLEISGPFAQALGAGEDNLVLRTARKWASRFRSPPLPARMLLKKNLPVASGIGGGSADAAATIRGLNRFWNVRADDATIQSCALELGADVPVCIDSKCCRMTGIGETLGRIDNFPELNAVLVNAMMPVETAEVFRQLGVANGTSAFAPLEDFPAIQSRNDWITWLGRQRNDLERPAVRALPVIADVLDALRASSQCQLASMSGSGATCVGIYADDQQSRQAADLIKTDNPEWWVAATRLR